MMNCLICNEIIERYTTNPGCIHHLGKYYIAVWYDGQVCVYNRNDRNDFVSVMVLQEPKHIDEEYINKLLLLM
jgi:hypothetical protein